MADDDKIPSIPPEDEEEEEVKTSVETIDAKRAEAERELAESNPPPADEDEDDDDQEDIETAKPPQVARAASKPSTSAAHATSGHGGGRHHGFAHVLPVKLLVGVLAILLVLTIATVAVTSVDLGSQWNLVAAMVIATIKAGLVGAFFMHLIWDKKFHLMAILTSVLFLILFLGLAVTDHKEYQHEIDAKEADLKALESAE